MARDFNEEIVCSYYELQGYFVRMNVPYYPTDQRKDASDIDIVAVHPREDMKCIACEVKGWHNERFTMGYWKSWPELLNFTRTPATEAVEKLIGKNRAFQHVLVVPPISDRQRGDVEAYAHEQNVELLEWPNLIRETISFIHKRRNENARNQTDHVLRVLVNYGFLNPTPVSSSPPAWEQFGEQAIPEAREVIAYLAALIADAKRTEKHKALGFASWQAYVADAAERDIPLMHAANRDAAIRFLSDERLSQRAIARAVKTSLGTVSGVLKQAKAEKARARREQDDEG
jgi:hypothetical protein